MVGFGYDGTNANIAEGGLKGILVHEMSWILVFWCLAHRLELAIKDALKSTLYDDIDKVLLRLYYIYEKSPKELEDIVTELKYCFDHAEVPTIRGVRPLRAYGTWFVAHKVAALKRVVDRFGVYLSHLTFMTEDSSIKSVDRQKMKGYLLKWHNSITWLCIVLRHTQTIINSMQSTSRG